MLAALTRIKPRQVFCVVADEYSSADVANAACENTFAYAGQTVKFEGPIDWFSEKLPADEEWRIEWSKFYFGLDLANCFSKTFDSRYLQVWRDLVDSWIGQVPIGHDSSDVAARRIQNWIYAWNIFNDTPRFPGFDPEFEERILNSLSQQIKHLRTNLTKERNHRTLELYALFIYALAFPEEGENSELLRFAVSELEVNIQTDILSDGVHRENSTHYHCIVLRSFLGALENTKRFGIEFSNEYLTRLELACDFVMHCHRPDGLIPALSDSDTGSYRDLLGLAARHFPRTDFLYAATAGKWGLAPSQTNIDFPDAGYYIQRSGWGENRKFEDENFLIFDCGRLGDGGHGHYDLLSFEAYANGSPLVVDPGRFTYAEEEPNLRHWFKGTKAHNTVCIDGLDQTSYRRGKPKGEVATGKFIKRFSSSDLDVLVGEARSPVYDAVHTRHIFFVNNRFWIIWDTLRAETEHFYDLRFQLSKKTWNHVTKLAGNIVRTPSMTMVLHGNAGLTIEPRWVSPSYGIKLPAPAVSFKTGRVRNADLFALIYPQTIKEEVPEFEIETAGETLRFWIEGSSVEWDKSDMRGRVNILGGTK